MRNELGRLLKLVSGLPGSPSGEVKWSTLGSTCRCNQPVSNVLSIIAPAQNAHSLAQKRR